MYYAYIANGQMVNTTQNDVMGYELSLDYLSKKGDTKLLETLRRNGPPPYKGDDMLDKYVAYLDILNDYMNSPHYTVIVPIIPFFAPEYGFVDKINHARGIVDSFPLSILNWRISISKPRRQSWMCRSTSSLGATM